LLFGRTKKIDIIGFIIKNISYVVINSTLYSKPIPQISWYIQLKDKFDSSTRTIDRMNLVQIGRMYSEGIFLCDTCGKKLDKCSLSTEEHILHLLNPMVLWSCDDCIISDLKNKRIIASLENTEESWKNKFI